MKRIHSVQLCLLSIFILFICCNNLLAQGKTVVVESWERRHNALQPPEKIMDAIGLEPGMVIGDIGAGTGRFAVWFADRVGPNGKVYANDIDKGALQSLEQRCKRNNINNIITVVGEVKNPLFPKGSLDIAFMVNVYHHLAEPIPLVKNIIPSLKPGGILVIVENDPVKSGYPDDHSTPKKDVVKQLNQTGFEVVKIKDFLEDDYLYICRPKNQRNK